MVSGPGADRFDVVLRTEDISSGVMSGVSGINSGIGGGGRIRFGKKAFIRLWFKRFGVGELGKKGMRSGCLVVDLLSLQTSEGAALLSDRFQ